MHDSSDPPETRTVDPARFVAGLAHRARTPLGSVLLLADLLREADPGSAASPRLERLREATQEVLDLLDRAVEYCREGAVDDATEPFATPFQPALRAALEVVAAPDVTWTGDAAEPDEALEVVAEPRLLVRLLECLLPGGRVEVAADAERVVLTVRPPQEAPESLEPEELFEAFSRAGVGVTKAFGQAGLALPLARVYAERIGAEVRARRDGTGLAIRLCLPRAATGGAR